MYSIAIRMDIKHKRNKKLLDPHIEANTYDYIDMNFENKSGTYVRRCVHLPMEHMYSIAIPTAPVHNPKTKN